MFLCFDVSDVFDSDVCDVSVFLILMFLMFLMFVMCAVRRQSVCMTSIIYVGTLADTLHS